MDNAHQVKSVDEGGPPWKDKHPGVPEAWKGLGSGGNAVVWFDGTAAIKRLHTSAALEAVTRFRRECELVETLQEESGLAVVPVYEVRERAGATEILMEKMDGNLDEVLNEYGGLPKNAALALIPIVETLHQLASQDCPIHHRDIKPSNFLYRRSGKGVELFLADFGCAYIADDERITPTNRAVGAWAYRSPEHSVGRVEDVSEKGDVFSLGKVLWSMINGERGVVFSGPVWYLDEFDLVRKYPQAEGIDQGMLAVARAVDVRPANRPSLSEFADMLRAIAADAGPIDASRINSTAILRAEAQFEVEYQQRRSFVAHFVRSIYADFHTAIHQLHVSVPESKLFEAWYKTSLRWQKARTADNRVESVAVQEDAAKLLTASFRRCYLTARFYPGSGPVFVTLRVRLSAGLGGPGVSNLYVRASPAGVVSEWQHLGEPKAHREPYRPEHISMFLEEGAPIVLGTQAYKK